MSAMPSLLANEQTPFFNAINNIMDLLLTFGQLWQRG
jgi:hypothetical protein